MEHKAENISLTSGELANLWNSYILNSKSKYILMYAAEKAKDEDIKAVMNQALKLADKILERTVEIYKGVNHPIPYGFKEDDVRVEADKLYSDTLMLQILKQYSTFGLTNYGLILSIAARADVRKFVTEGIRDTVDLLNKINDIAINKGIFVRTPNVPIPKTIEFAQSQSLMGAFLGHNRPLTSLEVAYVFTASMGGSVTQGVLTGLAQTREGERIRDFMARGRKLMREHIETLNAILIKDDLTIPPTYDPEVLNTTDSPFSDKIALYFGLSAVTEVMNMYDTTRLGTIRKDVILTLIQLSTELALYLKDGMDISIDNGWFEEMPKNIDRDDLIKSK